MVEFRNDADALPYTGSKMYLIRYYPCTPFDFKWRHYERHEGRTGTMPAERFFELKEDMAKRGMLNPLIVEYYIMELHHQPDFFVRVGHNRAEAAHQLGIRQGGVLFVVPETQVSKLPSGPHRDLAQDETLIYELRKIWTDVHGWESDAWKDSGLLLTLVREASNGR